MQRPPQQSKYFEHDLADMRAAFHQSMGFGCLLKRESLVNDWLDAPCLEQRPNVLAQIGRNLSLEGIRARTQSRAGDRQAPSEHLAKVNSVFRAAQLCNNDNSAIVRQAADFAHDVIPGDPIQNHINAPACRGLLNDLHKIFVAVIDAPLRSKLFACAAFLIRTCSRKNPMTESSGELNGGYADAGSSALHQQRLPLAQLSAVEYVAPYGKVRLGQGRAFDGAKPFRQRQALRQGGGAIFCVSATLPQRANHVPLLTAAFCQSAIIMLTCHFQSWLVGRAGRYGIIAGALKLVRPVHSGSMHLDQNFASLERRQRTLTQLQHLGGAVLS